MNAVTSPLVAAYLADLERRLADAPAADRLDVLDAVREHFDAAFADLGPEPSDDDVRRVLAGLGSPDDVAGALALGAPSAAPTQPAPAQVAAAPTRPRTSVGVWVLLVVAGLVAGLLVAPLVVALAIVHVAALVAALAVGVGATAWVGVRAFGPRAREPRRPWQMTFAVLLPAALVAGVVVLGSAFFLVIQTGSSEGEAPVVVVEE